MPRKNEFDVIIISGLIYLKLKLKRSSFRIISKLMTGLLFMYQGFTVVINYVIRITLTPFKPEMQ